jgi:predicted short-subunit dehydrogenase-like oxidoreductase (DUF2520 family)
VLCRTEASAQAAVHEIGAGQAAATLALLPAADIWLLALPDARIAALAQQIAALPLAQRPALVWHFSGFLPASTLAPLQALGWSAASAHPALSFAEAARAAAQFPGTVCALEGDALAVAAARRALEAVGGRCFELQAADKPLYHGAAVFASNFLPVLQAVATELWQGTGVPPDWVGPLANGFVRQVSDNLQALGPRAALTGPAARGDTAVLALQGAAMAARDPLLGEAYRSLSALAGRLAHSGQTLAPLPSPWDAAP